MLRNKFGKTKFIDRFNPQKNEAFAMRLRILDLLKPYTYQPKTKEIRMQLIKSYGNLIISKAFLFSGPIMIKHGTNSLVDPTNSVNPIYFYVAYGFCFTLSVYFEGRNAKYVNQVTQKALNEIQYKSYNHLMKLDPSQTFKESSRTTQINIYKAQRSIETSLNTLNQFFLPIFLDIVVSSSFLWYFCGGEYLFVFLSGYGGYVYFTLSSSDKRRQNMIKQVQIERKAEFTLGEIIQNYYNIKYFNSENVENKRYQSLLNQYQQKQLINQDTLRQLNFGQRVTFGFSLVLNLVLGVQQVKQGNLTVGDIVMMQSLIIQIFGPLFFLGTRYRMYTDSIPVIQQLFKLYDTDPSVKDQPNAVDFVYKNGEIQLQNVSFSYSNQHNVCEKLSFTVKKGEFVSITGESGIGKTTLFNLIFRLFDPNEGQILIDDQNIKNVKMQSFRKHIGVISQTPYLFNDSILNNILYSNDKKQLEDVINICKQLDLHDSIIQMPDGYDSSVGEQGGNLSGGQKQRICIARALLKENDILLMDEPSSSLDVINEMKFLETIQKQDKTIILITHRLNLNVFADSVIYLGKNGYMEQGKHQELITQNTKYQELWQNFLRDENQTQ